MRTIIDELINQMNGCDNLSEFSEIVNNRHSELRNSLSKQGINFYSGNQEIIGGQVMNAHSYEDYQQVNHIRRGITSGWVHYNKEYSDIERAVRGFFE